MSAIPKKGAGKYPVQLVVPAFVAGVARVMGFGAEKYKAWDWLKGRAWSEDWGAAVRHLFAWFMGEDLDPESGLPHLHHAAADIHMLSEAQRMGIGVDDRQRLSDDGWTPAERAFFGDQK